jgi:hypothetical protein
MKYELWISSFLLVLNSVSLAFAEGGNSGGGGNLEIEQPASAFTVRQILEKDLVFPLTLAFYAIERSLFEGAPKTTENAEIRSKIYLPKNAKDIFQIIKTKKLKIVDEPCFADDQKTQMDAFTSSSGEVCVSTTRVAAKSTNVNVLANTLAIVAHEYSHVMGLSEQQAKHIEYRMKSVRTENQWGYKSVIKNLFNEYNSLVPWEIAKLIDDNRVSEPLFCLMIGSLGRNVERLDKFYLDHHSKMMGLLKRSQFSRFAEVKLRAHKMQSYCIDLQKFPEAKAIEEGFQDKDVLPISEHLDAKKYGVARSSLPLRKVRPGDNVMLRQELAYLKAAVEELKRTSTY